MRSPGWEIDGLRHVVEPYVNYTYAPEPSETRDRLYFFDSVDRLLEQHFVRFGLNQRLQTRRSSQIYTLASLRNYADFHFHKEDDFRNLGDLGTKLDYYPRANLEWTGMLVADMGEPDLNRAETGFKVGDPKRFRTSLSYLYRNAYTAHSVYSMGSTLEDFGGDSALLARTFDRAHYLTLGFEFPINAKTSGRVRYEYDVVENRLARQAYEVLRDLHCWMGGLRVEEDSGDIQVLLVLYLKAFPKVRIDAGM